MQAVARPLQHFKTSMHVHCRASVKYKVTATMDIKGTGMLGLNDPTAEALVTVLPGHVPPPLPLNISEVKQIKSFGMFNKGAIQLQVSAPATRITAGEPLEVTVQVGSQCTGCMEANSCFWACHWVQHGTAAE
jgi:hypothetical protein